MNQPIPEEPLRNIDLESSILGLRMALTSEEETEAREKFLALFRESHLAVPTANPVATDANGQVAPGADISFVVVEMEGGIAGVPVFTTLGQLRAALPQVENGMFMPGGQLAGILASSPLNVFVNGPDMQADVNNAELRAIAETVQEVVQNQQRQIERNEALVEALNELAETNSSSARARVVEAFRNGFVGVPMAREQDGQVPHIMLNLNEQGQTAPLLLFGSAFYCFSGVDAIKEWDNSERPAVVLPGGLILQMLSDPNLAQAGITELVINPGNPNTRTARVVSNDLIID